MVAWMRRGRRRAIEVFPWARVDRVQRHFTFLYGSCTCTRGRPVKSVPRAAARPKHGSMHACMHAYILHKRKMKTLARSTWVRHASCVCNDIFQLALITPFSLYKGVCHEMIDFQLYIELLEHRFQHI
jgi:hypothetical protein